jgi:hypothetical protein
VCIRLVLNHAQERTQTVEDLEKSFQVTGKLWNILFMSYKQASVHVQYNGFISNNFAISQGVGQGRVISAWFVYVRQTTLHSFSFHYTSDASDRHSFEHNQVVFEVHVQRY